MCDRATVLRLAGAVEAVSEHAVAAAISDCARAEVGPLPPVEEFTGTPGLGVSGVVEGREVVVGSPKLIAERGLSVPVELAENQREQQEQGNPTVLVAVDRRVVAVLAVAKLGDTARPSSPPSPPVAPLGTVPSLSMCRSGSTSAHSCSLLNARRFRICSQDVSRAGATTATASNRLSTIAVRTRSSG